MSIKNPQILKVMYEDVSDSPPPPMELESDKESSPYTPSNTAQPSADYGGRTLRDRPYARAFLPRHRRTRFEVERSSRFSSPNRAPSYVTRSKHYQTGYLGRSRDYYRSSSARAKNYSYRREDYRSRFDERSSTDSRWIDERAHKKRKYEKSPSRANFWNSKKSNHHQLNQNNYKAKIQRFENTALMKTSSHSQSSDYESLEKSDVEEGEILQNARRTKAKKAEHFIPSKPKEQSRAKPSLHADRKKPSGNTTDKTAQIESSGKRPRKHIKQAQKKGEIREERRKTTEGENEATSKTTATAKRHKTAKSTIEESDERKSGERQLGKRARGKSQSRSRDQRAGARRTDHHAGKELESRREKQSLLLRHALSPAKTSADFLRDSTRKILSGKAGRDEKTKLEETKRVLAKEAKAKGEEGKEPPSKRAGHEKRGGIDGHSDGQKEKTSQKGNAESEDHKRKEREEKEQREERAETKEPKAKDELRYKKGGDATAAKEGGEVGGARAGERAKDETRKKEPAVREKEAGSRKNATREKAKDESRGREDEKAGPRRASNEPAKSEKAANLLRGAEDEKIEEKIRKIKEKIKKMEEKKKETENIKIEKVRENRLLPEPLLEANVLAFVSKQPPPPADPPPAPPSVLAQPCRIDVKLEFKKKAQGRYPDLGAVKRAAGLFRNAKTSSVSNVAREMAEETPQEDAVSVACQNMPPLASDKKGEAALEVSSQVEVGEVVDELTPETASEEKGVVKASSPSRSPDKKAFMEKKSLPTQQSASSIETADYFQRGRQSFSPCPRRSSERRGRPTTSSFKRSARTDCSPHKRPRWHQSVKEASPSAGRRRAGSGSLGQEAAGAKRAETSSWKHSKGKTARPANEASKNVAEEEFPHQRPPFVPRMWCFDRINDEDARTRRLDCKDAVGSEIRADRSRHGGHFYIPNMAGEDFYAAVFHGVWRGSGYFDPRCDIHSRKKGLRTPKTIEHTKESQLYKKPPGTPLLFKGIVEEAKRRMQALLRSRRQIIEKTAFKKILKNVSNKIFSRAKGLSDGAGRLAPFLEKESAVIDKMIIGFLDGGTSL